MADNKFIITAPSGTACYNNDSDKTIVQVMAPSTMMVKVLGWSIAFDGINVTDKPVVVELVRQSDAGTMSSTTPTQIKAFAETVQSTGTYDATAEPTKGVVLDAAMIHPQSGFDVRYPEGEEPVIAPSGYIGLVVNSSVAVNCTAKLICEE